ncbi:hypothetical protein B0T21DRAFT_343221 [Apiosordaria backusii]|uniref:Uncharacterized protein n=1 Tax=Apiosordaria backusii TaxID=314023 RepID=A0AA40EXX7_9PEZI|nr:hypothetical protein B0T21DRAFT_343221 [Apiosordaria backusii]
MYHLQTLTHHLTHLTTLLSDTRSKLTTQKSLNTQLLSRLQHLDAINAQHLRERHILEDELRYLAREFRGFVLRAEKEMGKREEEILWLRGEFARSGVGYDVYERGMRGEERGYGGGGGRDVRGWDGYDDDDKEGGYKGKGKGVVRDNDTDSGLSGDEDGSSGVEGEGSVGSAEVVRSCDEKSVKRVNIR